MDEVHKYLHADHINNEHDKIFRTILDNKNEASIFINSSLNLKIKPENLEKYNSSFISKEFRNQESDIVYKLKNKQIFFLIEHQTKIDYKMPFRILEYSTEIIRSAIDYKKFGNKNYKLPVVMPIVLYTENKKWNVEDYIKNAQIKIGKKNNYEYSQYRIIDVNEYTENELLESKSFLTKAMLLEKATNDEKLIEYTEKIITIIDNDKKVYSEEIREILISIIKLILNRKIGDKKSQELINKLEGGNEKMMAVLEMIDRENTKIYNKGITEGKYRGKKEGNIEAISEMAKKMINQKISLEKIMEITGLKKEEIEKLKENK